MSHDNISGEKLTLFRKRLGLSQTDLAHKLGVSPRSVIRWETLDQLPPSAVDRLREWQKVNAQGGVLPPRPRGRPPLTEDQKKKKERMSGAEFARLCVVEGWDHNTLGMAEWQWNGWVSADRIPIQVANLVARRLKRDEENRKEAERHAQGWPPRLEDIHPANAPRYEAENSTWACDDDVDPELLAAAEDQIAPEFKDEERSA